MYNPPMAAWHFYFLAKFLLHARGNIRLNPLLSAALLLLAAVPVPQRLRLPRSLAAWAAALALVWHESWLPPPSAIHKFLADPTGTATPAYLADFLVGALSGPLLLMLAALAAGAAWTSRRNLRLTPVIALGLAAIALFDPSTITLDAAKREVDAFYAGEAGRAVRFKGAAAEPAFDVIVVHVCSLSWDDLRAAKIADDPFLRGSHAVFTSFNSATSYSNPAAIRLLRAPCGQQRHDALFRPLDPGCHLMEGLRGSGYKTWAAANHDGRYAGMAEAIKLHGRGDDLEPLAGVPVVKLNFDDTAIYDDRTVLERWWKERQKSGAARAALYYNTISLHQGTHEPGKRSEWSKDRPGQYRRVAREFFGALDRFFALVAGSGRRALVLVVAEHGAALVGSAVQAPDLRDIPTPEMTLVPALVKLLGPGAPAPAGETVERPVSYLALAELLKRSLERPPFGAGLRLDGLPETRALSENEHARVLESGGRVLIEQKGVWKSLPKI